MFLLNEKVVYPGYGVAVISCLVERLVAGKKTNFFELKFYSKEMTVLIPEQRLSSIGVRKLSTKGEVASMIKSLSSFEKKDIITEHNASTWNKRNKEYQLKLRSGLLIKISAIYKELQLIALDKELSFGERNLFNQIENLLVEEIVAVKKIEKDLAKKTLRNPFDAMSKQLQNVTTVKDRGEAQLTL